MHPNTMLCVNLDLVYAKELFTIRLQFTVHHKRINKLGFKCH